MGKIRDFFKRMFGINGVDDFPLDDSSSQNPNEIVIRNTIDMTMFALKRAKMLSKTSKFELSDGYMIMEITDLNGNKHKLDLDSYIHHNDSLMTEKKYENECLGSESSIDTEYIKQEVLKRSEQILKH